MKRHRIWPASALVIALAVYTLGTATVSHSAVPVPGFVGYGTGTNIHVTGLQAGATGPRLVDTEVAFSGAASDSDGFGPQIIQNEMQVNIQPANALGPPPYNSSGRGSGLEVGVANNLPTATRQLILSGEADAVAPPNSGLVTKQVGPVPGDPLVYASLLRGQAQANFDAFPCNYGATNPLGLGLGYAEDAQLLNAGTANPDGSFSSPVVATDATFPARAVSQSKSVVYAIPNGVADHYGLVSETRETFAPIFVSPDPLAPPIVIELLGEWVFRATATGLTGGATIDYTVEDSTGAQPTPTTTIIRFSNDGGLTYQNLTFQDIFGNTGFTLPANPLLTLAIGEDPRAISAPGATPDPTSSPTTASNGTVASGAVDVVRLALLQGLQAGANAADLRIGHFEASVTVPTGGFTCTVVTTTTTAPTTTTTAAPQGTLEVCAKADNSNGTVTGNFTFTTYGRTYTIPVGTCTGPLTVPAGRAEVKQVPRTGYNIATCKTNPTDRLVLCDPPGSRAIAKVPPGGVPNETVLTFFERVVNPDKVGGIKVCKIAGNGVPVGKNFNFTVGDRTTTIPAGPASQGGYCKILSNFAQGSNVTITEAAVANTHVSSITVDPASRRVSSSTANRTATIKVGSGNTVVSFTNVSP